MKILSTRTHTIIGIVVGLALLVAPWLFAFAELSEAATTVALGVGLFVLLSELTTTSPLSLVKLVPMGVHVMLDILTGLFLLASPWLFAFADKPLNAWLPHVLVGLLIVGYAVITNTADQESRVKA